MAKYEYIAHDLDSRSTASFINVDGSERLISETVSKKTNGNNHDFTINQQTSAGLMHTMASGDINGDGKDDIIFSDPYGNVAAMYKIGGEWQYEYIAHDLDSRSTASFINVDGSERLISETVSKKTNGNNHDFTINQQTSAGLMHTMASGDINGDGKDDIIFSDPYGNVAAMYKIGGEWQYEYIAHDLDSRSTASFINVDGSERLISETVSKKTNGNNHDFTINQQTSAGLMHTMASGDINGDGKDDITFSDPYGNVAAIYQGLDAASGNNHVLVCFLLTRSDSNFSDVDVVMSDATNISNYKSAADGIASGTLTVGSTATIKANLAYSSSTKAISSQDALDALKLSVGLSTSAGTKDAFDYISADFNQDGKVSSQDALSILKYSVGLTTPEQAKWVFVDTNGDYSGVSKSNTSYTEGVSIADLSADTTVSLTGILIGDVNDSYSELIA